MRICIYGAGAIGGYLGAQLWLAGEEVTLIARGAHLAAMRQRGLELRIAGERRIARPRCLEHPAEAGPQDYVLLTVKAHALPSIAPGMQPLLGEHTAVVTATNGIPWWYFHGLAGPFENRRLQSVDPGGHVWNGIGPQRAIGCIAHPAAEIAAPGVVRHIKGRRFTLGEPDGRRSERVQALCGTLRKAGFKSGIHPDLRNEIWVKLWGNLCCNPISALTCATLDKVAGEPGTAAICRQMMEEAQAVAERLGVRFRMDREQRLAAAAEVGPHKTSMLQDLEQGRPLEIDPLIGAVQELGRLVEVSTPSIDLICALIRQRARSAGLGVVVD